MTGIRGQGPGVRVLVVALCLGALVAPGYAADVTLTWELNPEPDVLGYNVYYADMGETRAADWQQATAAPVHGPPFEATVPDGVRRIFYCTAVDTSGNESGPSNVCYMEEDTTPPSPPSGAQAAIQ